MRLVSRLVFDGELIRLKLDYAIVGSDSGRIVILEYDPKTNAFNKLHQETFGKSGTRRIVPGQYLATDPKGRSVMISATEKAKLVYILNRDAAANLTISSPLEAHKNHAIIHHIVGVDVGFDNPMYAALEVDYSESDQDPTGEAFNNAEKVNTLDPLLVRHILTVPCCQMLTFYELDLGLNHVVRKWSEPTDTRANLLVQGKSGLVLLVSRLTQILQFPEVGLGAPETLTGHRELSYAAKTTSYGGTWTLHSIVYKFHGGTILLLTPTAA